MFADPSTTVNVCTVVEQQLNDAAVSPLAGDVQRCHTVLHHTNNNDDLLLKPPCIAVAIAVLIGVTSYGALGHVPPPLTRACVCTPIWQFLFTHISSGQW